MKTITIDWLEDESDCDTCGWSYATGARVFLSDDETGSFDEIITEMPSASCQGGYDKSSSEIYQAILEKLGFKVEERY
jgi:hypothetical protein